ncbi:unnamed protein product, partial [Amoebophrya sp. A120]|eukprot:GSA120T00022832001.1
MDDFRDVSDVVSIASATRRLRLFENGRSSSATPARLRRGAKRNPPGLHLPSPPKSPREEAEQVASELGRRERAKSTAAAGAVRRAFRSGPSETTKTFAGRNSLDVADPRDRVIRGRELFIRTQVVRRGARWHTARHPDKEARAKVFESTRLLVVSADGPKQPRGLARVHHQERSAPAPRGAGGGLRAAASPFWAVLGPAC